MCLGSDIYGLKKMCLAYNLIIQSLSYVRLFCDPMDCSPPGFFVPGIFQARILECVTISFSSVFVDQNLFGIILFFNITASILNLVGQGVSWAAIQLCHYSMEAAMDDL